MNSQTAEPNEDPDFDPEEMVEAAHESSGETTSPELNPATAELTEWDEPGSTVGKAAPKVLPEDEVPAAELLIEEGLDEADREQRIAAADPDLA